MFATYHTSSGASVSPAPDIGHAALLRMALFAVLLLMAAAWPSGPAHAGVVEQTAEEFSKKVTDDPLAQKEIGNAVEAFAETLPNVPEAIRGVKGQGVRPQRGVSGPFVDLLVNFDKIACAGWLITFRSKLLELQLQKDPPANPKTIQAAQNLYNKVIFGCRKILDEETYAQLEDAPGTETTPEVEAEEESSRGYRVEVIDGETVISVEDAICAKMCRTEWLAWKAASRTRAATQRRITYAQDRINDLTNSLIPGAERRLGYAEQDLKDMKAKRPKYPRSDPPLNARIAKKDVEAINLRTQIAGYKAEKAQLEQEVRTLRQKLPGLLQTEKVTLQAYLDCLNKCLGMAKAAGATSEFAEDTIGNLQRRMRILDRLIRTTTAPAGKGGRKVGMLPGPDTANEHAGMIVPESGATIMDGQSANDRLIAIGTIRQGMPINQGNGVQPPFGAYEEDPSYQVVADVDARFRDAIEHGYRQDSMRPQTGYGAYPDQSGQMGTGPGQTSGYGQQDGTGGYTDAPSQVPVEIVDLPLAGSPGGNGLVIGSLPRPQEPYAPTAPATGPVRNDAEYGMVPDNTPVIIRDEPKPYGYPREDVPMMETPRGQVRLGSGPAPVVIAQDRMPMGYPRDQLPMSNPVGGNVALGQGPDRAEYGTGRVERPNAPVSTDRVIVGSMPEYTTPRQPVPAPNLNGPARPGLGFSVPAQPRFERTAPPVLTVPGGALDRSAVDTREAALEYQPM